MAESEGQRFNAVGFQTVIANLTAGVDRLAELLASRQHESRSLRTLVERIDERLSGFGGAVTALSEKTRETAAEVETLTAEQARLTALVTRLELRIDDRDQPQGLIQHALELLRELADRVTILEQQRPNAGGASAKAYPEPPSSPPSRAVVRPEAGSGGSAGATVPPFTASTGTDGQPLALERRVERLEWKEQTLSRIVQQLVDRVLA